ncbi:hypothetical protein LTR37_006209 [Vermiconidia calcicola]|uniref:Uncharacterized protein n=1 Tax=Vermiconidia calcicola TaxID=1690605 RepID=A0ACC3NHF9_9PEZI|nr:hypothetical protein LTR37_006209 [Vermiconidia calcicola]
MSSSTSTRSFASSPSQYPAVQMVPHCTVTATGEELLRVVDEVDCGVYETNRCEEQREEQRFPKSQDLTDLLTPIEDDYLAVGPDQTKHRVPKKPTVMVDEDREDKQMDLDAPMLPERNSSERKLVNEPDIDQLRDPINQRPWKPTPLFNTRLWEAHQTHDIEYQHARRYTPPVVDQVLSNALLEDKENVELTRTPSMRFDSLTPKRQHFTRECIKRSTYWNGTKMSLDHAFAESNTRVGIFNEPAVRVHVDSERQKWIRDMRKERSSEEVIDQLQQEAFGMSGKELDCLAESAREELEAVGQILPPSVPSSPKKKTPSPKANGKKRKGSDEEAPASRKVRRRTEEDSQPSQSSAGPVAASEVVSESPSPTRRSGRVIRRSTRLIEEMEPAQER